MTRGIEQDPLGHRSRNLTPLSVAPGTGLEPVALRLTAACTTIVLPRIGREGGIRTPGGVTPCAFRERRHKPDSATSPLGGAGETRTPGRLTAYGLANRCLTTRPPLPNRIFVVKGPPGIILSHLKYFCKPSLVDRPGLEPGYGGLPGTRTPNSWMPSRRYPVSLAARLLFFLHHVGV